MQAQDYFMWLLVISFILFAILLYTIPHLIHYLLHVRRTARKTVHNDSFNTDPLFLAASPSLSGLDVAVSLEPGLVKSSSNRIRARERNDLVVENDRVVRRSALQESAGGAAKEVPLAEPQVKKQNSFLDSSVQPIVHDELEPLDPGQLAVLVDAAEARQRPPSELEFGAGTQDPFGSLYLSPRTALEATRTIPRNTAVTKTKPALEDVFAEDEEESDTRGSSNEATLRMTSTLHNDAFDADERSGSRTLNEAVAEAQRTLNAARMPSFSSGSNEADLKRTATLSDHNDDGEGLGETSTDSGLSQNNTPRSANTSSARFLLDLSRTSNSAQKAASPKTEVVVASPPLPPAIELFPSGTVMTELGVPTYLHQQELHPTTLAPLNVDDPMEPVVVRVANPSTPRASPAVAELTSVPRYNSPKLQNVAAMVERFIPAESRGEPEIKAAAPPVEVSENEEESASFEGYPSPPHTDHFDSLILNTRLPPPPLESPRTALEQLPAPPRDSLRMSRAVEGYPTPPNTDHFDSHVQTAELPPPPVESPRKVLEQLPAPPRDSLRLSRPLDHADMSFVVPPDTPRAEEPLPDPPKTEVFTVSTVKDALFEAPPETPRFAPPPETPRFAPPPETPRFEEQEEGEGEWNNDEPLPDPPKSEVFSLPRREEWASPPSEEDESLDRSQLEDSADAPDSVPRDAHNLNPPSKGSIRGMLAELESVPPRPPLLGLDDTDVSGRRPTTLRGPAELALPELEAPESFQTNAGPQIE
jgi:hypothetical protein